jgi:hypothetical protein
VVAAGPGPRSKEAAVAASGGSGRGEGEGAGARQARVRGSEPGFQAGQLEAGRTTRPTETGGRGGAGGGAERRGRGAEEEEEGRSGEPRTAGRRETQHARQFPPPLPSQSDVLNGGAGEGPEAPSGSGVAAAAMTPPAPFVP